MFESDSLVIDPVSEDSTLYLNGMTDRSGRNGEYGTVETLTPAMAGTTQRFVLKPSGNVAVTIVDTSGKPVTGQEISLSIVTHFDNGNTASRSISNGVTDSEGKVVLRVPPGKVSVEISISYHSEWRGAEKPREYDLDLAPGETFDVGVKEVEKK
jgi:hypothetical protein